MTRLKVTIGVFAIAVLVAVASAASAETISLQATLTAAAQVPPADSKGSGSATVSYDTASKKLDWKITYEKLTGDPTAAHFHGPAPVGKNAGPVVPITGSLASPIQGSATLTDAQAKELLAGLWYINVHTVANPGGEIRGQVLKAK
jgi:hypothetical protein